MQLRTGESFPKVKGWSLEQIEKLGQKLLLDLSRDIIFKSDEIIVDTQKSKIDELRSSLELDGYTFHDDKILIPEQDVIDVKEETDVLSSLFNSFDLDNYETAFHHLRLSEEHYINHKWDDSISNSRKFFESVLQEVANKNYLLTSQNKLSKDIFDYPFKVRDYLEKESLLERKEKEAVSSVYSLLSHTGGHPYMAQNEQARLLRHLALTFSQFVMLKLRGKNS